jgi:hypothetical protein
VATVTEIAGTIGLTSISGDVGKAIEIGQWANGEGFARWEHAFILLPAGMILEAEPGGARIVPLHYTDVYWCRNIRLILGSGEADPALLNDTAEGMKGIGYSFLDYAALSAYRLHLWTPGLKAYIGNTKHEICSQLDDDFYLRLGAHIFDDGRWPGYVTPASLYRRDLELAAA